MRRPLVAAAFFLCVLGCAQTKEAEKEVDWHADFLGTGWCTHRGPDGWVVWDSCYF